MKKNVFTFLKINLVIFMAMCSLQITGQTLPGTYTTSWVGNTIVPTANDDNVVQNWANSMFVDSDGTLYANSNWDEAARELGVYKNGLCTGLIPNQHGSADGGAITVNADYVWASENKGQIGKFSKTCFGCGTTMITVSTLTVRGLAASATEVFVSDNAANQIKVYSASSNGLLRSWSVTRPGPLAMDASGNVWVLTYDANVYGPGTGACIKAYSSAGTLLKTLTLATGVQAKSIAIDKTNNELLVTDIGNNMQIHIYNNINGTPAFVQSFGTQGGILSGTKGLVAPLKFNVPSLTGVDASHNIYVWSNGNNPDLTKTEDYDGMGSCVESYTRSGSLNWQMLGLEFVDMGNFDPSTDGADLYTKNEHFTMDYSKPDGQQWTWKGWTQDVITYGNSDVRFHNNGGHLASPMMRRLNGNLFMYLNSMSGGGFSFFRFTTNDEIAIPCGELRGQSQWNDTNGNGQKDAGETSSNVLWQYDMFGNFVDNKGDIWYVYDDIRKHTLQSITNGVPIYNLTPTIITAPAPFNSLRRVQYDSDNDIMYLSGYTAAKPYTNDWKSCGLVMARYNNWSTGNRTAAYTVNLPTLAADGSNMVSLTVEKEYIFVVGVQTRGKAWVYNSTSGVLVGTMVPGSNVGGVAKTGWCDIVNSIGAFKKSTGEYLVTVEEDGWAKILIYRWTPGTLNVTVTGVTLNQSIASLSIGATLQLTATVAPSDATNKSINWTTSSSTVATVSTTGLITAKAAGTATITVTTVDGSKTASCAITVNIPGSWTIVDDAATGWTWGSFVNDPCPTCYNGTSHSVNANNKSASCTFTGTDVEAFCETWNGAGSIKIYIDGVLKGTYSQNITPYGGQQKFATIAGLTNASHTIKFTSTSNSWVGIDYIRYAANPLKSAQIPTGIDNPSISPINVYPNPASDFVTIDFGNSLNNELSHIKIVDMAGKKVYESSGTKASMKISTVEFLKGVYLISIRKGDEMYNSKLIIK